MCESGILRPFISVHNAVFCVLNDTTVFNDKHAYINVISVKEISPNFVNKKNLKEWVME